MKQFKFHSIEHLLLDIEKLLLYMAFYGKIQERRLMSKFFDVICEKFENEESDNMEDEISDATVMSENNKELENYYELFERNNNDSPEEIIKIIFNEYKLDSRILDAEHQKLQRILQNKSIHFISVLDDEYPSLLRQIKGYPFGLFFKGDISLLQKPCVAVVGSRKATYDADKMCDKIALHLKHKDVSVVSGLAFGVDSLIHKACLRHGVKTISVLPSCVDKPIPVSNRNIANKILEAGGLLISENPPNFNVRPESYVERNRIISGIADRTLVVEAKIKSGSMSTAKFAIEQNRDLYAMVGSISNPVAEGCNYLISQGAKPLVYAKDFYDVIDDEHKNFVNKENKLPESDILDFIKKRGRVELDEIIENSNLSKSEIISKLTEYEIFGYIRRQRNYVELV